MPEPDLTGRRKAGEDRKQSTDDIIGHAGGNRDLAEVATHQAGSLRILAITASGTARAAATNRAKTVRSLRADERLG